MFLWKMGKDLFKKLKQQSCEFIVPSISNKFLIPNTRSMFSWISDTGVFISNLCPGMCITQLYVQVYLLSQGL